MSLTRIGSIGINTGIAFAGVTTIVTLNTANDALSIGSTVNVGSGITLGASGDIFATGVSTVTTLKVGSGVTVSSDGDVFFTGIATGNGSGLTDINAANLTLTNQASDTECFPVFAQAPTNNQLPHTNTSLKFNASTGALTATSFVGSGANLTGIDTDLVSDTSPQLGGNLDVNSKTINLGDSSGETVNRIRLGADNDGDLFHDGTDLLLREVDSGQILLRSDGAKVFANASGSENQAIFRANGNVELYYDNSKKFETTSGGVSIDGQLDLTSHLDMGDNDVVKLGDGDDLQLYHDGSNSYVKNYVGNLFINANDQEKSVACVPNGAVELYHDNTKKFETTSSGAAIGSAAISIPTMNSFSCQLLAGASGFLGNYHDGTTNQQLILGLNQYFDSAYKAPTDAVAAHLQIYQRTFRFNTAPAPGSAGGTLSHTQALRIDTDGIKFGTDTAAANALDDYEEGTFTISFPGGVVITNNEMAYTKIGRLVTCTGRITFATSGSNSIVNLQGLPFTPNANLGNSAQGGVIPEHTKSSNDNPPFFMAVEASANTIRIRNRNSGALTIAQCSGQSFRFILSYFAS